ncbi:MAG: 4-hydroxybenzoate octaprenyltransferase [Proteobacteria bacterium]|nr:4-hydroxybenzoate octaprenyltransferase [Pseudomonadota bacterium]
MAAPSDSSAAAASAAGRHTDIRAGGWIARLPPAWRPYALLARLDRPIGVWLLFLPGLWGIVLARPGAAEALRLAILFAVGAAAMRAAGCVVNDLWDRDIDRRVARTAARPLAAGTLRPRQAFLFLAALLLVGLAVLLQLQPLAQALGVGSLVLVALYPLAKRVTWWPQLVMGFTFGFGAPMGYAAASGRIDAAWAALYAAAILWDLGFDTIYAHQDREDDALVGVKSTARLFGERTRPFLAACYAGTILMLAAAGWLAGLSAWFYPALALPAALLAWQVRVLDIDDPALCLRLFRANREAGLAVAAALLAGWL